MPVVPLPQLVNDLYVPTFVGCCNLYTGHFSLSQPLTETLNGGEAAVDSAKNLFVSGVYRDSEGVERYFDYLT